MAYIDKAYYSDTFKGREIPEGEFDRLADIASDLIYDVCRVKPKETDLVDDRFKKAVAYQVEFLYEQGGTEAIMGRSEAAMAGSSESLGDYSVSANTSAQQAITTKDGIPVSSMAVMQLRRLGLMSAWAFADFYRGR